jgi:hypothetical protein
MGRIGCPEKSVNNYQSTPRNIPVRVSMEYCCNDSDGGKLKYSEEKAPVSQLVDYQYHIISLRRSLICAVSFLEILSNMC